MLARQSKKRSISDAPRLVTDFTRAMPGIPLIASSIGFVTVISICCAGTSPLSTTGTAMTTAGVLSDVTTWNVPVYG